MAVEDSAKPPYATYKSFTNLINDLRENGTPPTIEPSVLHGSNSGKATMAASLRSMGLTNSDREPQAVFVRIIKEPENYSTHLQQVITQTYPYLFDGTIDLKNTTTEAVKGKFMAAGVKGSTITKAIGFFLAASKDANIEVADRVKPPPPPASTRFTRKKTIKSDEDGEAREPPVDSNEGYLELPDGMRRFEIPMRDMEDGVLYLPEDMEADKAMKALRMIKFTLEQYYDVELEN